jgi:hypothetical protein
MQVDSQHGHDGAWPSSSAVAQTAPFRQTTDDAVGVVGVVRGEILRRGGSIHGDPRSTPLAGQDSEQAPWTATDNGLARAIHISAVAVFSVFRWQAQDRASAPAVAMPLGMDFWYTVHGMCRGHN